MSDIPKIPDVKVADSDYNEKLVELTSELLQSFSKFMKTTDKIAEDVKKVGEKKQPKQDKETPLSPKTTNIFQNIVNGFKDNILNLTNKVKEGISDVSNKTVDVLNTTRQNLVEGLAGPFKLLTQPLKELTGIDFVQKIGEIGKIKSNMNPSKKDLSKTESGQAELYRQKLLKKYGKDPGHKEPFFKNIGSKISKALPLLMTAGAIGLIAGGLLWAVIDGIKGAFLAEKWGVNKISAFVGAFLGGTGSGWKNAFKQGGKWALVGVGTGFLVGGPIGALVGGLIGTALGGIMGYFGGEKIAKGFSVLGQWLKDSFLDGIMNFFKNMVKSVTSSWDKEKSLAFNIGASIRGLFTFLGKSIIGVFKSKGNFAGKGALIGFATTGPLGALGGGMLGAIVDMIIGLSKIETTGIESEMKVSEVVKKQIGKAFAFIGKQVFEFIDGLTGGGLTKSMEALKEIDPLGKIKDFVVMLKDNLFGFLTYIGDFFGYIGNSFKEKGVLGFAKEIATGGFGEGLQTYRDIQTEKRNLLETDLPNMNEQIEKIMGQKNKTDEQILEQLKQLNSKELKNQIIEQNNVSTNTFDANNYRKSADYRTAYGR